jgi:hypothetical protein
MYGASQFHCQKADGQKSCSTCALMNFFIQIQNSKEGPFTMADIKEGIEQGRFSLSNLAWRPGSNSWIQLVEMSDVVEAVVPPFEIANTTPCEIVSDKPLPAPTELKTNVSPHKDVSASKPKIQQLGNSEEIVSEHRHYYASPLQLLNEVTNNDPTIAICLGFKSPRDLFPFGCPVIPEPFKLFRKLNIETMCASFVFFVICLQKNHLGPLLAIGAIYVLVLAFWAFAYVYFKFFRGFEPQPDVMILTQKHYYLIQHIHFRRRTGQYSFERAFKSPQSETSLKQAFLNNTVEVKTPLLSCKFDDGNFQGHIDGEVMKTNKFIDIFNKSPEL